MRTSRLIRSTVGLSAFAIDISGALANSPPIVSNVTSAQRTDGSRIVDIRYNLSDADGDDCTVTAQASSDGGATWTVPITLLSGAVGAKITPGNNKLIVWNCVTDLRGAFGSQHKVRVIADDGYNPVPTGMVLIPAGSFEMGDTFNEGSSNEHPVHSVQISAFYIDRYEVTNQQYADALNWAQNQGNLITVTSGIDYRHDSSSYAYCDTIASSSYSRITWDGNIFGVVAGKANHPMARVSWYGSAAYANWRNGIEGKPLCYNTSSWSCNFAVNGYRLPTEAEWEKAARGGTPGHRFPWSDNDTIQHARANFRSTSIDAYDTSPTSEFHPVWGVGNSPYTSTIGFFDGSLRYIADFSWPGSAMDYQTSNGVNGFGLHDIAGNVWEWCNDWYSSSYYSVSPGTNPQGPASGGSHVLRGGAWGSVARECRCAIRLGPPDDRSDHYGFRLAANSE